MRRTGLLVALLFLFVSRPAAAQELIVPAERPNGVAKAPGMHFVLDAAFEGGGDRILTVTFTDGSTQDIYAGQGGTFAVGLEYRLPRAPRVALGAMLGYKFVTTAAEDANIKFTRVPIDLTARVDLNRGWWVAGGATIHTAIEFDGDGFVPDASLASATGVTAELGWKWIGLTVTAINYDNGGSDLSAMSAGVVLRWVMGR